MKKNTNENRPDFALMKLSGAISYFHMQMPRWLFCDPHYTDMSLEAKVAYTFLLNRYQLSRRNGWVNRHGEVYIIYTREDLAREMQVSYRKAISCFKDWRTGSWSGSSGRAAACRTASFWRKWSWTKSHAIPMTARHFPRSPDLQKLHFWMRMTMQPRRRIAAKRRAAFPETKPDAASNTILRTAESAHQDMPEPHVLNCKAALLRVRNRHIKTCKNRTQVRKIRVRKNITIRMIRIR